MATALWISGLVVVGCSGVREVQYGRAQDYDFRGRTVGLVVIVDGDEQRALDDRRIIGRALSDGHSDGYVDPTEASGLLHGDVGVVRVPTDAQSLNVRLTHARYADSALVRPLAERTSAVFVDHGYHVAVLSAPTERFQLRDVADRAAEMGCDLLAVEILTLAQSWNVEHQYRPRETQEVASSFRWRTQTGGLVVMSLTLFDVESGRIVWQHDRREADASRYGPLLGEVYSQEQGETRFGNRPGEYQAWMYRQAGFRALRHVFATAAPSFAPLPFGGEKLDSLRLSRRYSPGDRVVARPSRGSRVWHVAHVAADSGGEHVDVQWLEGMWREHSAAVRISRAVVEPLDEWPSIVWIRARDELVYAPQRFLRSVDDRYVYVSPGGAREPQTYNAGRVGVVPMTLGAAGD